MVIGLKRCKKADTDFELLTVSDSKRGNFQDVEGSINFQRLSAATDVAQEFGNTWILVSIVAWHSLLATLLTPCIIWKHSEPTTGEQLKRMHDEFWDNAPHYCFITCGGMECAACKVFGHYLR
ncbi:hypothetical protein L1987_46254 [Smallanthus sonchifolius]|uniref:Uncharacterized protein n=1 Tax=Smallanthus sonchifolius TaxID=185202 RepID=A0ACB9FYN2_9ASTR|nr:hypothetical protein L1987_46254 [Smallanthus sonchifolius]